LRSDIAYELSEDQVGEYTTCVHKCLDHAVMFPEVDPGSDDESSSPSSDNSSSPSSHAKGQVLRIDISYIYGKGLDGKGDAE
jgi:hypothetical protein